MEIKLDELKAQHYGNELIQEMLRDILVGLKKKLFQPIHEQNLIIAGRLEELKAQDQAGAKELAIRLEALENRVQQVPLLILAALRDAINQAGGENPDGD